MIRRWAVRHQSSPSPAECISFGVVWRLGCLPTASFTNEDNYSVLPHCFHNILSTSFKVCALESSALHSCISGRPLGKKELGGQVSWWPWSVTIMCVCLLCIHMSGPLKNSLHFYSIVQHCHSRIQSYSVFEIAAGRGRFHGLSVESISSEVSQVPRATPWHSKADMLGDVWHCLTLFDIVWYCLILFHHVSCAIDIGHVAQHGSYLFHRVLAERYYRFWGSRDTRHCISPLVKQGFSTWGFPFKSCCTNEYRNF